MRPASRFVVLLAVLSLAAFAPVARSATPVQFEAAGLVSQISGNSGLGGGSVSDFFSTGYGFSLGISVGMGKHLSLGYRTGLFDDSKDIAPELAPPVWSSLPGYNRFQAANATNIHRKLTSIPHHAILGYHARLGQRFGFYDEFGLGLTSFTGKMEYYNGDRSQFRLSAYQLNFSMLLGGGVTWDYQNLATLVAGVNVLMVPTQDGDVWSSGDNPQYIQFSLGFRYPRR